MAKFSPPPTLKGSCLHPCKVSSPFSSSIYNEYADLANQTAATSPDNQNSSNTTLNELECSNGFYFDVNRSGLCLPECGEFSLIPLPVYILGCVIVVVCFISSMIMIIIALTIERHTL